MVVIWFHCASLGPLMWFFVGLPTRNVPEHARSHKNTYLYLEWTRVEGAKPRTEPLHHFKGCKDAFQRQQLWRVSPVTFHKNDKGCFGNGRITRQKDLIAVPVVWQMILFSACRVRSFQSPRPLPRLWYLKQRRHLVCFKYHSIRAWRLRQGWTTFHDHLPSENYSATMLCKCCFYLMAACSLIWAFIQFWSADKRVMST